MTTPNNQPTPPDGYRAPTEEELNCLPEGTQVYAFDLQEWEPSVLCFHTAQRGCFYAIPITPTVPATGDTTNEKGGEQRQELLPCPFCGSDPFSLDVHGVTPDDEAYGYWAIECPKCNGGAFGRFCGVHGEDQKDAETKWNTRK